ncbi:hypothetical protein [Streptomyces profundus]|uniref:hypothetical protein n=1 Tax=Streptomyces profundus TaxID=2867410 RepID=UPI001D15E8CF|nr:hypothetical protein [Streptomyces sp. MA3_2.13]UED85196.1 hypothetical protein K4G22_14150 [Streptomyces sp. MA3_2.13]
MRYFGVASVTIAAIGLVSVLSGTATAATAATEQDAAQSCGAIELSGSLPAPPEGMSVQQTVTIGEDCEPELGPVEYVPVESPATDLTSTAAASRQIRSWSEMYDCCNIRMTGLYSTADWNTEDGRIVTATTTATQEWNREPWNAGWSLESASDTQDCAEDCSVVNHDAVADFSYQGIFDPTGNRYANTHHSSIQLNADATADCTFDVQLKNTFIGWNWQRGCE